MIQTNVLSCHHNIVVYLICYNKTAYRAYTPILVTSTWSTSVSYKT